MSRLSQIRRTLLLFFLFCIFSPSLYSAEYSLYGDASLFSETGGADRYARSGLNLMAEHSLSYEWGEARFRHKLTLSLPESGEGQDTQAAGENIDHRIFQASILYLPLSSLSFTFGRHQLGWGMSYAFFPADALHPVRSRNGDVPGFDGASSVWTITPDWTLTGAVRIDEAVKAADGEAWWEELRYAGSLSGFFGGFELLLSQVYKPNKIFRPGLGLSFQWAGFVFTAEGAAEFLCDETFYDEMGLTPPKEWDPAWKGAVGIEKSFYTDRTTTTVVAEYLYDAGGMNETGESFPVNLARNYLFVMASFDYDALYTTRHSAYINLEESAAILSHSLSWSNGNGLELWAEGNLLVKGEGKSEADILSVLGKDWRVRLGARIFF